MRMTVMGQLSWFDYGMVAYQQHMDMAFLVEYWQRFAAT
jgi:hypothetical protein